MTSSRYIEHIIDPDKLLLSWQPPKSSAHDRMRRFVAELFRDGENVSLRYLRESDDFIEATKAGFEDYPGFSKEKQVHENVLPAFMRRLPPRKRNDFGRFLTAIRINPEVKDKISDFALLGYAGAKLPGDGFVVVNTFSNAQPPFELMLNVQGFGYRFETVLYDDMTTDMQVTFEAEPDNSKDPDAIMAMIDGRSIGYVCRGLNTSFHKWWDKGYQIEAVIERINGTKDDPKIYALVKILPSSE